MTMTDLGALIRIPDPVPLSKDSTSTTLDDAKLMLGNILLVRKTGNIRNIWLHTGTVTTAATLKLSLQTVTNTGYPSGTIMGAGNAGYTTQSLANSDDNVWLGPAQLGVDVAVTQGEHIAVVVEWNSAVGQLAISATYLTIPLFDEYTVVNTGTWGSKTESKVFNIILEYDDGTYAPGMVGAFGGTLSIGSTSNPDEIGNSFKLPMPVRAVGFWLYHYQRYAFDLSLLDADDNVLANLVADNWVRVAEYGEGYIEYMFDSDPAAYVDLDADTYYRMVITHTTSSSSTAYFVTVPEAAAMGILGLGENCIWTQRTDAGSWTETATKRYTMGLILSGIDIEAGGSGGGMLIHPGMSGGCRG